MKRRRNPRAPWRWQYQSADGTWHDDIREAEAADCLQPHICTSETCWVCSTTEKRDS